ncbi:MAG: alcohol dehydrogenase catalytic domain-containing protein [Candidatus Omnitrophica bacterium]|nr:alcohol dehydrogenase catalytic domain-containing protein [Candidatus Omnitrophota bacterium]
MRVAKYYNNHDIRLEEYPKPEIGPGEILVRVRASGICGTDVMEWYRIQKAPRVLGHEITGEIVASKSEKYRIGQRVFVSHHVPCNQCKYCLEGNHTACNTLHEGNYDPGGYSEFVRVPRINVEGGTYVLPASMTYEEGTLIEPLACAIRGQRLIQLKKGHTLLIVGSGVSGLLNIQLAKLQGTTVFATDIHEYRLRKAKEFGADQVFFANQPLEVRADRVILCTGALEAAAQTFACIDRKGVILFFAIPKEDVPIPILDFWRNEITVTSTYGAAPVDLEKSLDLIQHRKVNVKDAITHMLPLERIQEGFNLVVEGKESLKVVLTP